MRSRIFGGLLIILCIASALFLLNYKKDLPNVPDKNPDDIRVACTMDAKICPDGTAVGRTGPNCEFEACPSLTNNNKKCFVGGCSGQICSDTEGMASTCEWREEYACYKTTNAKCERQLSGQCGWTPSNELTMCLDASK